MEVYLEVLDLTKENIDLTIKDICGIIGIGGDGNG